MLSGAAVRSQLRGVAVRVSVKLQPSGVIPIAILCLEELGVCLAIGFESDFLNDLDHL